MVFGFVGFIRAVVMFNIHIGYPHFVFNLYNFMPYLQWRRKMPKSGGAHRHVIYLPSVKNQYKRAVFGYMVIYEQPSVSVY